MNPEKIAHYVERVWEESILPKLCEYIAIPCKSPAFDANWESNGYMNQAVELLCDWAKKRSIEGMKIEVLRAPQKTPLIFIDIPGKSENTVLLYGHMDKQPEMVGWADHLGPWKPVISEGKLYGRGGADDGYSIFAALTAIEVLQKEGFSHARCVVLIEASEESGSMDLPYYLEEVATRFPSPDLVICLDSGCGNYSQLWCTTSLRGVITGNLKVQILKEGVHSGSASGIVPSSFRIVRQLLSRLEQETTGKITLSALNTEIPLNRLQEAQLVAEALGEEVWTQYPWVEGAHPDLLDHTELLLNRSWRPTLSVTGVEDIPPISDAGNVLRPQTSLALSFRIPPTTPAEEAANAIKNTLEFDPPYGSKVNFEVTGVGSGWEAPAMEKWLIQAINGASQKYFGNHALYWGEGGSIPFMAMLGKKYPKAQFMITGVLGPRSNAHGPNEFLEIQTAKRLTACVADVLMQHYQTEMI